MISSSNDGSVLAIVFGEGTNGDEIFEDLFGLPLKNFLGGDCGFLPIFNSKLEVLLRIVLFKRLSALLSRFFDADSDELDISALATVGFREKVVAFQNSLSIWDSVSTVSLARVEPDVL